MTLGRLFLMGISEIPGLELVRDINKVLDYVKYVESVSP